MNQSDIPHLRLRNQRLIGAAGVAPSSPEEVVGWLVAVQAQDYAGAKWALRLRMQAGTGDRIDQALEQGSILRTHLLRPTWHFVTPADIRWLLALNAPRIQAGNATMYRQQGLDAATLQRSQAALVKALEGGNQLTRLELRIALENAGIVTGEGLRLVYILMCAELEGVICSGGRRGRQFTYALLDERVPPARMLERPEALAELTWRYFLSRGPATLHDYVKWSGLTIADARSGLEDVKDRLVQAEVGGQVYWLPDSTPPGEAISPNVHLLSIFDEYISGYKDRRAIADVQIGPALIAMGNALTYIIVVNGQIVGTWRRDLKSSSVLIETTLFKPLTEAEEQAVAAGFQRYGEFLELPVVMA